MGTSKINPKLSALLGKLYAIAIVSIVLTLLDLLIGERFAVLSWKSYCLFAVGYVFLGIGVCLLVMLKQSLFAKIKDGKPDHFDREYFITVLLFFDFVIINWKLFGGYDFFDVTKTIKKFFSFKVLLINLLLVAIIFLFAKTLKNYLKKNHQIFDGWMLLKFSILVFSLTNFVNFYLLRWPDLPNHFLRVLSYFFLIVIIPFLSLWAIIKLKKLMAYFQTSGYQGEWIQSAFLVLLAISFVFIFNSPVLSSFNVKNEKTSTSAFDQDKKIQNIIWIVMDTARRDHFSCYGYERKTTPNIDKFARESVKFTNYFSSASWTLPSHASMFTGLYSSTHGAHHLDDVLCAPLSEKHVTIAEILRAKGFNTAAFAANGIVSRPNHFEQGFDFFYFEKGSIFYFFWGMIIRTNNVLRSKVLNNKFFETNQFKLSSEINKVVFHVLKKKKKSNNFIFINYMEPHFGCFYLPAKFKNRYDFSIKKWTFLNQSKIVRREAQLDTAKRQIALDWLDCRMSYLDHNIGTLFERLKQYGMYDNSLIILVSDHGDLYGEHNSFGHSRELYNEVIHVPLIVKYPKSLGRKGENATFVQTVDIMPEILNLLGYDGPKYVQGKPFAQTDHEIIAEAYKNKKNAAIYPERYYRDLRAIITTAPDSYKYIKSSNGLNELFDLQNDPFEQNNLCNQNKEIEARLEQRLTNWTVTAKLLFSNEKETKKLDKRLEERLKALGYIR